jgi:hypothetical protein
MPFIRRLSVAKAKHVRGLLRAGGYIAVLSLGFGAFQLRAAHAEVKNRTVELGRQMYQLANATQHDVNKLTLNGQPMYVGSSVADDSVARILNRYADDCSQNAAQPVENWRELAKKVDEEKKKDTAPVSSTGVMRGGSDREGTVVCFTKGASSKPTLGEALKTFADTGELGALGNLRYVYAKESSPGHTLVLTAWTDDKFNLSDLVPNGDVETKGSDFADIPRPDTATRMLSAQVEGTPFGVNIYRNKQGPMNVAGYYDAEMSKRGWFGVDTEMTEQRAKLGQDNDDHLVGRIYEKKGVVLTLATHLEQDGDTITTLGLAGVTSSDGTKTDTGVKASDMPPAPSTKSATTAPEL